MVFRGPVTATVIPFPFPYLYRFLLPPSSIDLPPSSLLFPTPLSLSLQVILLFTAHSLPMKVVAKGDTYVHEIASTVRAVMEALPPKCHNTSVLAWQSKVGFLPWMAPSTASVIKGLGAQGHKYVTHTH